MWTVESGYFLIRWRHKIGVSVYLANLNTATDRRQRASVLVELISSLSACMQQNVALLNAEISYARRRLDICKLFTLSTGQNGRHTQLKRVGKQCRPRRFWVRPGRTSAWWGNFVNLQWIRSESQYVWTGEFDMNTLWSHNVWTQIFSYPERKSCGLKNIRIRVDGALLYVNEGLVTILHSFTFLISNFCHIYRVKILKIYRPISHPMFGIISLSYLRSYLFVS